MQSTLKESNHKNPLMELLVNELGDLLHAEAQVVQAVPKMAEAAHHPRLKEAFQKHASMMSVSISTAGTVGYVIFNQLLQIVNELPGYRENVNNKIKDAESSQ